MKTINFLDSRTPKERKGELKPVTTFAQFSNMKTKEKSIIIFYIIFAMAKLTDLFSTIQLDPSMEENPIVKYIWESFGDIGLIVLNLISIILVIGIIEMVVRLMPKTKTIFAIALTVTSIFIFLIALANTGNVTAYMLTSYIIGN